MRFLLLNSDQRRAFSLLKAGDRFEINKIEQTVLSLSHPEQDCTYLLTNRGTLFLQGDRLSFTKKPTRFPWIRFPMHIESLSF